MVPAMHPRSVATLLLTILLLPSCARFTGLVKSKSTAKKKPDAPYGPTGIPPALRSADAGTPIRSGGNVSLSQPVQLTAENDIAWTDPDNPDGGISELAPLLAAPKKTFWEVSETIARQRSSRENKPLLIWFSDSKNSPGCKGISAELFADLAFNEWAKEKFIRLKIDSYVRLDDPNLGIGEGMDREIRLKNAVVEIKKRYKILGQPTFLVLASSGDVVATYKGYRSGQADYTWGLFRQGQSLAEKSNTEWRADLMKKGYREWQDRKSNKVFAKLLSYSKGQLSLIEPDGKRSRTTEARLSDSDQSWIKQQKTARGIE
jgi:thioredoxin-related protein